MFVCLSLVEAAVVTFLVQTKSRENHVQKRDNRPREQVSELNENNDDEELRVKFRVDDHQTEEPPKDGTHILHKTSRVGFPAAFLVFNVIFLVVL